MDLKIGQALFEYVDLVLTADRNRFEKMISKKKDKADRKGNSKSSKKSPQKHHERVSIFSSMENDKLKHLFEEIKKAEEEKGLEKISDDEVSEGSSDKEDEDNDLSQAQATLLIDVIKGGKCGSVSRCKMRVKGKKEQNHTTEDAPLYPDTESLKAKAEQ